MAPEEIDQVLKEHDAPARDFWENELEIGVDGVARSHSDNAYMEDWIGKRAGRQVEILRRSFGMNGARSLREKKMELHGANGKLFPYLLVQEFCLRKSKMATIEWAKSILPSDVMELCQKDEGDFDTLALCFALYAFDPSQLRCILHLDQLYKRGAARMIMKQNRRRPPKSLHEYLTPKAVAPILKAFDKSKGDGRTGELMNIMPHDGRHLVFIRRCLRPSFLLRAGEIVHGHQPEWIVLEFFDGAKRVNICSTSVSESLEIANRIASAYYRADCEFENECEITYASQIVRLLAQLRDQQLDEIVWVELNCNSSPLIGEIPIMLADRHFDSIGPSVIDFENKVGPLIDVVDRFESIKVIYRKKRVKLIFEKFEDGDDEYVMRYTDHTLNPLQRKAFEDYMRATHEIPILSTEKRFKGKA